MAVLEIDACPFARKCLETESRVRARADDRGQYALRGNVDTDRRFDDIYFDEQVALSLHPTSLLANVFNERRKRVSGGPRQAFPLLYVQHAVLPRVRSGIGWADYELTMSSYTETRLVHSRKEI